MRVIHQLHLSIVSLLLTSFLFSSAVDADVNWLTSNQQLDGSIHLTTDIASSIQSTAETLNTPVV